MPHSQDELSDAVGQICSDFPEVCRSIDECTAEVDRLSASIDDAKMEIADLVEERRSAPRRERWYYRDLIADAKDRKYDLIRDVKEKKFALRQLRTRRREIGSQAKSLRQTLHSVYNDSSRNLKRLDGNDPEWARSGTGALRAALEAGRQFSRTQLELLDEVIQAANAVRDNTEIDYERSFQIHADADSGETDGGGNVPFSTALLEPPRREHYSTLDGAFTVPCYSYTVSDALLRDDSPKAESIGTCYASALLTADGHDVILELGGPGKPDMISLDSSDKLWITEVKGTAASTPLYQAGLLRRVNSKGTDRDYDHLYENSREWLMRSECAVLEALDEAVDRAETPSGKERLRALRQRYVEAVRSGFAPGSYLTQVVQVGLSSNGDYLAPPQIMQSGSFDQFCIEVGPKKIVQVDVVSDSDAQPTQ